uniref:DUF148 domain-containing protein n=1 Tax=Panagrellus redivivus TaxID=6233 RepID=A0A7E4VZD7_PANRE
MKLLLIFAAVLAVLPAVGAVRRRLIVRQNGKVVNEIDHANFGRTCEVGGICTYELTAPAFNKSSFDAAQIEVNAVETNETSVKGKLDEIVSDWNTELATNYTDKANDIRAKLNIVNQQIIDLRAKIANITSSQVSINQTNAQISSALGRLPQCYKNALVTCATTTTVGPGSVTTAGPGSITTVVTSPSGDDNSTTPSPGPTETVVTVEPGNSTATSAEPASPGTGETKTTDGSGSTPVGPSVEPTTHATDGGSPGTASPTIPDTTNTAPTSSSIKPGNGTEGDDSFY